MGVVEENLPWAQLVVVVAVVVVVGVVVVAVVVAVGFEGVVGGYASHCDGCCEDVDAELNGGGCDVIDDDDCCVDCGGGVGGGGVVDGDEGDMKTQP